jgi:dTDP-4-dehydrorhamnose 3,5-epimerase-like enzyme
MKVKLLEFEIKGDDRGSLIALENQKNIPFKVQRVYYVFDTKSNVTRGLHAHKDLRQVAVCVSGSCKFHLSDGFSTKDVLLDSPTKGLFIDSMIWREMSDFSDDCVLMVLADSLYDENDYIRDYEVFIEAVKENSE